MFAQTLLPALAVFGIAAAQTSSICSQATATINSQADATQYASCTTIDGDVLIGTTASGAISIDGPTQLTGSLICQSAPNLQTLGSTTLASIGKDLTLNNLTMLSTFSFTDLTSVNTITLMTLPRLGSLTLPSTISKAQSITVSNTFLDSLDGINIDTCATLEVNNNGRLTDLSTQISNVTSLIDINSNDKMLTVEFPNLIWAANLTLKNVSSVSVPSLSVVNGSLGLYSNYFTTFYAPNLTTVGNFKGSSGGLAINANPSLSNLTIPGLTSIGGAFQIQNNSALNAVAFSKLADIGGAIAFAGNFTGVSLPALAIVNGGSTIDSTADLTQDCATIKANKAIAGKNNCQGGMSTPSVTVSGGKTITATGSTPTPTKSTGAAVTFGVSEGVVGLGLFGTLMQMLL